MIEPLRRIARRIARPARRLLGVAPAKAVRRPPDVEASDTYLASFPRSGNTWVRHMLAQLHPGAGEDVREVQRVIPSLHLEPDLSKAPQPRVLKTHLNYDPDYPRVIYVLRDGRDAVHSWYRYSVKEYDESGTFREFLEAGAQAYKRSWHEHVDYWLGDRRTAPTLLVRYEDMERDAAGQLRRMVDFMDWTIDDSKLQAAVDSSRIDKMRSKEQDGEFLAHIGRGGSGRWKDHYSAEELAIFLAASAPTLRHYGYLSEDSCPD